MLKFKMIKIQQKGYFNSIHEFHFFENKILGNGSFGLVLLATHIRTCNTQQIQTYSQINLNKIPEQHSLQTIQNQNIIHGKLQHPHIVKLWDSILDDHRLYMIMEYVEKGSLFHHQNACEIFSQVQAFKYFYQTLQAVKYLHHNSIIHRDLKPQNLLLDTNYNIKLCDLGWSTRHLQTSKQKRNTFCGTYEYMAPQIIFQKDYDQKVDIWALGVLLYQLVHGHAPFQGENLDDVRQKMVNGGYRLSQNVSQECKQLIISVLKFQPQERITIQQIEKHVWLNKMQKQLTAIYIQNQYYSSPQNLTKLKLLSNVSHPSIGNISNISHISSSNTLKHLQHYRNNTQNCQNNCTINQINQNSSQNQSDQLNHQPYIRHNRNNYNQSIQSNLSANQYQKLATFLDGFVASTSNTIDVSHGYNVNNNVKDKDKQKQKQKTKGKNKGNKKMSVDSNFSVQHIDQKNKQEQITPQSNKLINVKQRTKKQKQASKQKQKPKKHQKYQTISIHQNRLTPPDITVFNSITEHELQSIKQHELFTRRKTNITHDDNTYNNKMTNKRCKTVTIGSHQHSQSKKQREWKQGRMGERVEKKKDKRNNNNNNNKDKDKERNKDNKMKQKKQIAQNRNLTPIHHKKKSQDILSSNPGQFSIYMQSKRRYNNSKSKSKSKQRVYQKESQKQKEKVAHVIKNISTKNLAKNSSQSNLFTTKKKQLK